MNRFKGILIGKDIAIEGSHLEGKVINESKQTITIRTKNGEKKVIKGQHAFIINGSRVEGQQLLGRPEERIKN